MAISAADAPPSGERWQSRRLAAWTLRAVILLAPLLAAIAASLWISKRLFEPESALQVVAWWILLIGFSSVVAWTIDRLARKLLPLAMMLKATMLFPDQAPSRYKVALRTSNVTELRRRIAEHSSGNKADLSAAAALTLSLAKTLNDHDRKTRGHGERTRAYADMLAEEMKIPEEGRDKLRWAALLHDIGKLEIPAEILNRDGPLTEEEMALIRRHPLMGMRVAAAIVPWLGEWAGAIEHHHERWDGSGYPRGLAGTDISLAARIVSVADSYDVMTSGRAYQAAMSPAEAREELARMAGTQFDPAVVRAFMNISLGRLRWALAPVASLGPIPFFLDRIGRDILTVSTAATVTAAAVVAGAVPLPARHLPPPPAITASAEPGNEVLGGTQTGETGNGGIAAPTGDTTSTTVADSPETTPPTTTPPTTSGPVSTPPTTTPPTSTPVTTPPPTTTTSTPPVTAPPTTTPPKPQANPDVVTTSEDKPITVAVLDNDKPSGLILTSITSQPNVGTATLNGHTITYTPAPEFNGTATFGYRACDEMDRCAESTVAVNVTPVNDPPVVVNDSAATTSGSAVSIAVLANDTDPDGDALSIKSVTAPANGTSRIDGPQATYRPAPGYTGTDSFSYTACDPSGACATGKVTVTVTGAPPRAVDDNATTNQGGGVWIRVLANDSDPDGELDQTTLSVITPPDHGTFRINWNRIRYFASKDFRGTDTFVYRICDNDGLCDTATVTVTVR